MAKKRSNGNPRKRRARPPERATKLPSGTFEEWLGLQAVKPAETKPEVQAPPDSYDEWISKQVGEKLKAGVEGAES